MYANRLPLSAKTKAIVAEQAKRQAQQVTSAALAKAEAARALAAKAEAAAKANARRQAVQTQRSATRAATTDAYQKVAPFNKRWATASDHIPGVGKVTRGDNFNYGITYCVHCKKKTGNEKPFQFLPGRMVNGVATRTRLSSKCPVCHFAKSTFVATKQSRVKGVELGKGYKKNEFYPRRLGGGVDEESS